MKAIQAFYSGRPFWQALKHGDWFDVAIRLWTFSPYSHTELIIDGVWYSSSIRDGGARTKVIKPNPEHWDYEIIEIDVDYALQIFNGYKGKGYDRLGILFTQFIDLNIHSKSKVFCSELNADMRKIISAHRYSPKRLGQFFCKKPKPKLTQDIIDDLKQ